MDRLDFRRFPHFDERLFQPFLGHSEWNTSDEELMYWRGSRVVVRVSGVLILSGLMKSSEEVRLTLVERESVEA